MTNIVEGKNGLLRMQVFAIAYFYTKNMYVCVALTIVFYALWTYEMSNAQISWTIPIFIILLMSYSLDVEGDSDGDPVEVILHDKILIGILILYALFIFGLLYAV